MKQTPIAAELQKQKGLLRAERMKEKKNAFEITKIISKMDMLHEMLHAEEEFTKQAFRSGEANTILRIGLTSDFWFKNNFTQGEV